MFVMVWRAARRVDRKANKHPLVVTFEQNSTPRSRHKNERDHYVSGHPLTRVELIHRVASHDIGIFCYRDVCRRAERHDMRATQT
jgi:hypothetical protein